MEEKKRIDETRQKKAEKERAGNRVVEEEE